MKLSLDYVTAMIDGEGTITLSYNNKGDKWRMPVISVASTTIEILNALKETYGGCICNHKVYKDHHVPSFSWRVSRRASVDLCAKLQNTLLVPEKRYRAHLIATRYLLCTPRCGKYTEETTKLKLQFEHDFFHPSKPLLTL